MLIINGKEINDYKDYALLKGEDILAFMKEQSDADLEAFKQFCSETKTVTYEDGTTKERPANFFEIRNWVLDRYAPGIRETKKTKAVGSTFIDQIMEL